MSRNGLKTRTEVNGGCHLERATWTRHCPDSCCCCPFSLHLLDHLLLFLLHHRPTPRQRRSMMLMMESDEKKTKPRYNVDVHTLVVCLDGRSALLDCFSFFWWCLVSFHRPLWPVETWRDGMPVAWMHSNNPSWRCTVSFHALLHSVCKFTRMQMRPVFRRRLGPRPVKPATTPTSGPSISREKKRHLEWCHTNDEMLSKLDDRLAGSGTRNSPSAVGGRRGDGSKPAAGWDATGKTTLTRLETRADARGWRPA